MIRFKIFEEDSGCPTALEDKINLFFENRDIKIINVSCVVERRGEIDYKIILIFYEA